MNAKRLAVFVLMAALVAAFFWFDLGRFLTLGEIKARHEQLTALFAARPLLTVGAYAAVYLLVTALSLPGAALLTLLGGAMFGLGWGTLIVSFASSIGATLAFLASRFLFRDIVQRRFASGLAAVNRGIEREGAFYLFTLRLVPIFPFFLVNLVMGLTSIPVRTFYWVSQVGMLAGTLVYVNLGTQLARIDSLRGLLGPTLLASLALLGVFPLLAKRFVDALEARKVYRPFKRPDRFDRNLVVIGAGSAGLVTAYIAAAVKAKVTLIEKNRMGGDCLNTGCVPSKALIRSAKLLHQARQSERYGIRAMHADLDFAEVMQRVQRVIERIEPHDSVERYASLGVECLRGEARIRSPWEVEVRPPEGAGAPPIVIRTRHIVVAAGARPLVPPIPGLDAVDYLTSDNLWSLRERPARLLVLGGGPIGCELAQCFARLGSEVTQVEMAPRLLAREDPEVSALIAASFEREGIQVLTRHKALRFERDAGGHRMIADHGGAEVAIGFDRVLLALGRKANVTGYGLEELGVSLANSGTIEVNDYLETSFPNILACGDVAGPYQFTHTAAHMAWYASVNALFGRFRRFRVDYSVIPWCTFTDPEVARVGLSESEARERGVAFEIARYDIDDLDRAIADDAAHGFVKVITKQGSDRILGATIVGEHAGDLISEFVSAMKHGLGLNKILGTIHVYPTLAEANKYAAGNWRRAHAPERLLEWVRRYHQWRLG